MTGLVSKLHEYRSLPAAERNARIRLALGGRFQILLSRIIYSTLGKWLNTSASRFMIELRPDSHAVHGQYRDFDDLYRVWTAGNRQNNGGDLARFYLLYLNLSQILKDNIPGDFVEIGVYKGNSAAVLASFARRNGRKLFLFDTFGGFDARDLKGVDEIQAVQFTDTSLEAVRKLVGTDSAVEYVQGYFPESALDITIPEKIAFVHIDCDLFDPIKASLEMFYPRVVPGGLIFIHDYSSGFWPGAAKAVDEFFQDKPEKPILAPDKAGTAIIRKVSSER